MRTKNAMLLKAHIRNRAKAEGVPPQLLMQNYLIETLAETCDTVVEIMEAIGW